MSEVKIIAPHYSGEYTMGTVTTEFVEYWSNRENDDLLEYLHEVNWAEGFQSTSPTETGTKHRTPFHDIDDIEHSNMPYIEPYIGDRFVYVNHEEEEIEFKPYMCHVRHRDNVLDHRPKDSDFAQEYIPVLEYASTEKGYCGHWLVELKNETFDKSKFVISTVQTALGRFVDGAWYGSSDEELYFDMDDVSTVTKETSARVGWIHHDWYRRSKRNSIEKILNAKNNHVNLDKQGSIQGFDLSKYI